MTCFHLELISSDQIRPIPIGSNWLWWVSEKYWEHQRLQKDDRHHFSKILKEWKRGIKQPRKKRSDPISKCDHMIDYGRAYRTFEIII